MISVIIPFDKDRGFLKQAIQSVHKQTYKDVEIILSQSNKTTGFNMNQALEKASGEFVCYLCEDDVLTENSLTDRLEAIQGFDFIHGRSMQFNENGNMKEWTLTDKKTNLQKILLGVLF